MRVDDGQLRLEGLFLNLIEPVLIRCFFGHGFRLPCLEPVNPCGIVMIELCLLVCGIVRREDLERVPKRVIAATDLVDREVRFKQTAVHTELLDRVLVVGSRRRAQFLAGRRFRVFMPLEPVHLHVDAAELGDDVLARRQSGNSFLQSAKTSSRLPA